MESLTTRCGKKRRGRTTMGSDVAKSSFGEELAIREVVDMDKVMTKTTKTIKDRIGITIFLYENTGLDDPEDDKMKKSILRAAWKKNITHVQTYVDINGANGWIPSVEENAKNISKEGGKTKDTH